MFNSNNVTYTPGKFHTVRVEVLGDDINVFLNEVPASGAQTSAIDLQTNLNLPRAQWTLVRQKKDFDTALRGTCSAGRTGQYGTIALWSAGED